MASPPPARAATLLAGRRFGNAPSGCRPVRRRRRVGSAADFGLGDRDLVVRRGLRLGRRLGRVTALEGDLLGRAGVEIGVPDDADKRIDHAGLADRAGRRVDAAAVKDLIVGEPRGRGSDQSHRGIGNGASG